MVVWIDLPGDEATPTLSRLTAHWRKRGLDVPAVVAVMKPSPDTLRTVIRMNDAVSFGGSSLGRRREELIATTVSALGACFY